MNYPAASYGVSKAPIRNGPFAASCGELTRMRLKRIISGKNKKNGPACQGDSLAGHKRIPSDRLKERDRIRGWSGGPCPLSHSLSIRQSVVEFFDFLSILRRNDRAGAVETESLTVSVPALFPLGEMEREFIGTSVCAVGGIWCDKIEPERNSLSVSTGNRREHRDFLKQWT
jgi:hypothetical protein